MLGTHRRTTSPSWTSWRSVEKHRSAPPLWITMHLNAYPKTFGDSSPKQINKSNKINTRRGVGLQHHITQAVYGNARKPYTEDW